MVLSHICFSRSYEKKLQRHLILVWPLFVSYSLEKYWKTEKC